MKLTYALIFVSVGLTTFICGVFALYLYYRFYKRYTEQVANAFEQLRQRQMIVLDDYYFFQQLGAPGFGYLVSLLAKILKGERYQIAKNRWIEPEASNVLRSLYDFTWIKKFYQLIWFIGFLLLVLLLLVIFKR